MTVNGEKNGTGELKFDIKPCKDFLIEIAFEVKPVLIDRPYNLRTVRCGSLVFSLPIKFEKRMHEYIRKDVERKFPYCDYELIPQSDFNYAFAENEFKAERRDIGEYPFSESNPPIILKTKVCRINWGLADGYETVCAKIPESTVPLSTPETAELYPYGCAKLRMTEMPIIKK